MSWWNKIQILTPLDGYNRWASTYHTETNPVKQMSDAFVSKHLTNLAGKTFLDAGCGTGKFCELAKERGATTVQGFDLSPAMVAIAQQHCPSASIKCLNLESDSVDMKADVVVCALVLAHIHELEPALNKIVKALNVNGKIIITDFHPFLSLLKARRTFRDSATGKIFEVKHTPHFFEEYFRIFSQNHIRLQALEEPKYLDKPAVFGMTGIKER